MMTRRRKVSEIRWIKIVTDIFADEKILLIESMPEADTIIVIWFKLLCLAGIQNNLGIVTFKDKIPYTDEMLATIMRRPLNTVRLALETFEKFGMIERSEGIISIPNWEKHQNIDGMEKVREQGRERQKRFRENQKLALLEDVTLHNVTVTEQNRERMQRN
jgi:predicted phage replisome organizer